MHSHRVKQLGAVGVIGGVSLARHAVIMHGVCMGATKGFSNSPAGPACWGNLGLTWGVLGGQAPIASKSLLSNGSFWGFAWPLGSLGGWTLFQECVHLKGSPKDDNNHCLQHNMH